MKILVCCVKKDYFLAKICVASIRYFYPDVPVYLLKDELGGQFDTAELEKNWNVQTISYPVKKFGWSAAKMFFYTDERFKGQRFLVLDADIVIIGKLLEEQWLQNEKWDVIVSHEMVDNPYQDSFTRIYFDTRLIEKTYPQYHFPGYSFNCGQLFIQCGAIAKTDLADFFDFSTFPFWSNLNVFPLVDQSVFNYLLPTLHSQGRIDLVKQHYMLWSEEKKVKEEISLETIISGGGYPFLIHWAGAARNPVLSKMSRTDILSFFENLYYSRVPQGKMKQTRRAVYWLIREKLYATGRLAKRKLKQLKK